MTAAELRDQIGVSRETAERLDVFVTLLRKWNRSINLVSAASLADVWRRHVLDSAQVLPVARSVGTPAVWLDLGSGAGFPGLVLAILGAGEVHLVESDSRKCAFLAEASRATGAAVRIHTSRIEELAPWPVDVVTARAVAPLPRLLDWASPFGHGTTQFIFLKGQDVGPELTLASKYWKMNVDKHRSRSNPAGTLLRLTDLSRRDLA